MYTEEKIESILENEIGYSFIEEEAVNGLFKGIHDELKSLGIDRDHEAYDTLFDRINNRFIISRD
jgi:hypothetical protein